MEISATCNLHIVTWEKNYKWGEWSEDDVAGSFVMERCRNCKEDVKLYGFRYMDVPWGKDPSMRLLRVEAKNPILEKMEEIKKDVSKLEVLIEGEYSRLVVSSKQVMDVLKLIARNSSYGNHFPSNTL